MRLLTMQTDISAQSEIIEIIPAILEKDWESIEKKLEIVKSFAKTVHIDILDGKLFNNTTFMDPAPFKKYSSDLFLELHMMVEEPINYLDEWAAAGFKRFIGHVEKMSDQAEFVAKGQLLAEVGLALDGPTELDQIGVPLDDLDVLLCMAIESGFSGRPFTQEYLKKLEMIKETTWIPIEVDGGINDKTILQAKALGATRFCASSFLFSAQDPRSQYDLLTKLLVQ